MKTLKNAGRAAYNILWKDESAQGALEYIFVLVAVITLAIFFKGQIMTFAKTKMTQIEQGMNDLKIDP